ncbi:MAG: acetylglutamate kinase [Acidobacteriota bacterium]|nr:acetylglutamate kinase [Acidobacteriota bacterium]
MNLVIKLSGKVLEQEDFRRALSRQITSLVRAPHRVLLIHGGGKQLSSLCERLGIPVVQHEGRRVTDEPTLDAAKMVFSAANRDLVASLNSCGARALGFASFDAGLVRCRRRGPIPVRTAGSNGAEKRLVDFGLVGEIESVDPRLIKDLWTANLLPVVSCLCATGDGRILNINADTLAARLATALRADRLVSVTDVEGLYLDDFRKTVPRLTAGEVRMHLRSGAISGGMIPKMQTALKALEQQIPMVQIVGGLSPNGLIRGIEGAAGTCIVP